MVATARTETQKHDPSPTATLAMVAPLFAWFFAAPVLVLEQRAWQPVSAWELDLVSGWLLLAGIAKVTRTRILVDDRGRWSLSRVQIVLWTCLLLPTLWTMATVRMVAGAADPVALGMDDNLWLLLGISMTSFVASPLILQRKEARSPGVLARTETGGPSDLFRGEDTGNAGYLDLGRVQMVFFTALTWCVYFAACHHALGSNARDAVALPAVSQNLVALLGISHATYLVNKNTDRPAKTQGGSR